jgi:hypothetical protein
VVAAAVAALGAVAASLPWPAYSQLLGRFLRLLAVHGEERKVGFSGFRRFRAQGCSLGSVLRRPRLRAVMCLGPRAVRLSSGLGMHATAAKGSGQGLTLTDVECRPHTPSCTRTARSASGCQAAQRFCQLRCLNVVSPIGYSQCSWVCAATCAANVDAAANYERT